MSDWDQAFDPDAQQPVEFAFAKFYFGPQGFYLWQTDDNNKPDHADVLTQELGEDPFQGSYQNQVYGWVRTAIYANGRSISDVSAASSSPYELQKHAIELAAQEIKKQHPEGTVEWKGQPVNPKTSQHYAQRDWYAQWLKQAELEWNPRGRYDVGFKDGWKYIYTPDKQFHMWPVTGGAPHHAEKARELLENENDMIKPGYHTGVVDSNGQITNLTGVEDPWDKQHAWGRGIRRDDEVRDRVQQWLLENGHEDMVAMKPPEQDEGWQAFAGLNWTGDYNHNLAWGDGWKFAITKAGQLHMWPTRGGEPHHMTYMNGHPLEAGDRYDVCGAVSPDGEIINFGGEKLDIKPKVEQWLIDNGHADLVGQHQQEQGWEAFAAVEPVVNDFEPYLNGNELNNNYNWWKWLHNPRTNQFAMWHSSEAYPEVYDKIDAENYAPVNGYRENARTHDLHHGDVANALYGPMGWYGQDKKGFDFGFYEPGAVSNDGQDDGNLLAEQWYKQKYGQPEQKPDEGWDAFATHDKMGMGWQEDQQRHDQNGYNPPGLDLDYNCYTNAQNLADSDPSLTYIEGLARLPDDTWGEHAWCMRPDGTPVDPYFDWKFPGQQIEYRPSQLAPPFTVPGQQLPMEGMPSRTEAKTASMLGARLRKLIQDLPSTGGFSLTQGYGLADGKAYFVAEYGYERTVPLPKATPAILAEVRDQAKALGPDRLVGAWYNSEDHLVYFDVAQALLDLNQATEMAEKNQQIAIWDGFNQRELRWDGAKYAMTDFRGKLKAMFTNIVSLPGFEDWQPDAEDQQSEEAEDEPESKRGWGWLRPQPQLQFAKTAAMQKWLYLNNKVMFHDQPWFAAHQLGIETGMKPTDAQQVANWIATGNHPRGLGVDVAMGTMLHGKPAIWFSTVDRNQVYDAVEAKLGELNKTAMAERSGDPQLDALIEEFLQENPEISPYKSLDMMKFDPDMEIQDSQGQCGNAKILFDGFLREHGIAPHSVGDPNHPLKGKDTIPDTWGYQDRGLPGNEYDQSHDATLVTLPSGTYSVDWTCGQYGYKEFPMVQRLDSGEWQREWSAKTAADDDWAAFDEPAPDYHPDDIINSGEYQPGTANAHGRRPWYLGSDGYIYIGQPGTTHGEIDSAFGGVKPKVGLNGRIICGVIAEGDSVYAYDWGDKEIAASEVPRVRDLFDNGLMTDNPAIAETSLPQEPGSNQLTPSWQ